MELTITLDEVFAWTEEERAKWRPWLKANPKALEVVVQPGGRFPTVASLIDHILLVEHRHTARLQGAEVPAASGIDSNDIDAMWAYGDRGRRAVKSFVPSLTAADANTPRDFLIASRTYSLSPRKMLFHLALHEMRHWAQIAALVRAAGFAPPGDHDLFFSKALM